VRRPKERAELDQNLFTSLNEGFELGFEFDILFAEGAKVEGIKAVAVYSGVGNDSGVSFFS
jgi:hypothetical protein